MITWLPTLTNNHDSGPFVDVTIGHDEAGVAFAISLEMARKEYWIEIHKVVNRSWQALYVSGEWFTADYDDVEATVERIKSDLPAFLMAEAL